MIINTRQNAALFLAGVLAALVPNAVSAHDTWFLPDRFDAAPQESVTLHLTSSMAFPKLESGPKRERVASAKCRLAGQTFDITDISAGPKSLVFKSDLPAPGVATLWVTLPPKSIELTPEQVEEYLEEIDAPAVVRKQWTEMEPKRWRELYAKHQKTFVRVGAPGPDLSWAEPAGTGLEIVPEKDPTTIRAGAEFSVRVLKDGAPHADFALNAVAADETKGETRRTDASGRIVLRLNKAGRWLLRGTDLRKSSRGDTDWESDFVTLTLEVKAKQ
ncbi:MAG: DUF4198 domain-containing protein [Burkholderiaceae bacterium]|nr:DUF4198 domain-containing protein [Burkholderiaceae bacterium]